MSMDTTEQQKTYKMINKLLFRGSLGIIAVLIILALWRL